MPYFLTAVLRVLLTATSVFVVLQMLFAHAPVGLILKAIALVGLLIFLEEAYAFSKYPKKAEFFSDFFKSPFESDEDNFQPLAVFDGDRTFVQILGAVSATFIGLAFDPVKFPNNPGLARWIMAAALFFSILFLNLQGAGVQEDSTANNKRQIKFEPGHQEVLLLVRSLVYWTFFYGIAYILIAAK